MTVPHLKNIHRLLLVGPVHIKAHWMPDPPHWRSGQIVTNPPHFLGEQLKQQRLKLRMFQADLAERFGVSVVSVSHWERGVREPSRRMRRSIREFLAQGLRTATDK